MLLSDLALNIAFTVEMVLRILSIGGILAYLRHPWNSFDCVMVLAGYTTFIPMDASSSGGSLEGLKALRALRAMRPLRTITRWVHCTLHCSAHGVWAVTWWCCDHYAACLHGWWMHAGHSSCCLRP
jgi:hypothetical protein